MRDTFAKGREGQDRLGSFLGQRSREIFAKARRLGRDHDSSTGYPREKAGCESQEPVIREMGTG